MKNVFEKLFYDFLETIMFSFPVGIVICDCE